MNCKKIQQWLMTDYLDNELGPRKSAEADRHLKECSACREFLEAVRKNAVTPFKDAKPLQPDPVVWERIQERIQSGEESSAGWHEKLAGLLAPFLRIPKPVFRAAFATALIVTVIWVASRPSGYVDPAYAYMQEQAAFMDQLKTGDSSLLNGDLNGYGAVFGETAN